MFGRLAGVLAKLVSVLGVEHGVHREPPQLVVGEPVVRLEGVVDTDTERMVGDLDAVAVGGELDVVVVRRNRTT